MSPLKENSNKKVSAPGRVLIAIWLGITAVVPKLWTYNPFVQIRAFSLKTDDPGMLLSISVNLGVTIIAIITLIIILRLINGKIKKVSVDIRQ